MAYPGTYDINYYKGDTFEFKIYPKDTSGATFNLSGYLPPKFKISNSRGGTVGVNGKIEINAYAQIVDNSYILCAIRPEDGASMNLASYVYDVEIGKNSSPYDYVYTLLSGKVTVTEQVNSDDLTAPPVGPTVSTGTGLTDVTNTSYKITWTAATTGDAATSWKVYKATNPLDPSGSKDAGTSVAVGTLNYNFTGLAASNAYSFGVAGVNAAGEGSITWLGNYLAPNAPTNLVAGTATSTSIPLTWTVPAVNAGTYQAPLAGYYVFLNGNTTPVANITNPAATSTSLTGLSPSTSYTISLVAYNSIVGTPFELLIDPDTRLSAPITVIKSTTA